MKRSSSGSRSAFLCLLPLAAIALPGCSSGGDASELSSRPDPRPLSRSAGRTLRLPADEKFSITLAPASRSPGLNGSADSSATATREGEASAVAKVSNGGTASATFQIGHALKNDSDQQTDMKVRAKFSYEYATSREGAEGTPTAALSLNLYAHDSRKRLIQTVALVQHAGEEGPVGGKDTREVDFVLTLGPGDSTDIFLAGVVSVTTREEQSAEGSIKLSGLQMEFESRPAPPVKKPPSSQPG